MPSGNLFTSLPIPSDAEVFDELLRTGAFTLERIVSTGQATPPGEWLAQARPEWVVLLTGAARLRFEDESAPRELQPGDWLDIAPHRRHRVEWTDPARTTVWLAIHFEQ